MTTQSSPSLPPVLFQGDNQQQLGSLQDRDEVLLRMLIQAQNAINQLQSLNKLSTDDLAEGENNLYLTKERVREALYARAPIRYDVKAGKIYRDRHITFNDQAGNNQDMDIDVLTQYARQVGVMTAPRAWTLPLAAEYEAGSIMIIADESGTVGPVNTLAVNAVGADTIN
jgi:hypothetical protein